jgi:death on curing protein
MRWLQLHMVEAMHAESIERFGGSPGTRDPGLLESALARPVNIHAYEPEADIFRLAAAYCAGIVKNHPFVDGNKRTGILAANAFLHLNGFVFSPDEATVVTMIVGLAAGDIGEDTVAEWLRANSVNPAP